MKQTRNILCALFWAFLALALFVVVLFESGVLFFGYYAGSGEQAEFLLVTMMELLTLATIPLSLKLFRFKGVRADLLTRKALALQKWGLLRLLMLFIPIFVNTMLYYMYANTTFGYMAIILVIVLPFVYPSMNRCIAETSEE